MLRLLALLLAHSACAIVVVTHASGRMGVSVVGQLREQLLLNPERERPPSSYLSLQKKLEAEKAAREEADAELAQAKEHLLALIERVGKLEAQGGGSSTSTASCSSCLASVRTPYDVSRMTTSYGVRHTGSVGGLTSFMRCPKSTTNLQ